MNPDPVCHNTKQEDASIEKVDSSKDEEDLSIGDVDVPDFEEKAILRKIDMIILPMMFFSYVLQFLDKTSLGNVSILGIIKDANLKGQEFSWLNSAFYFGYLIANYPVSVALVKFPLGKVLGISIVIWAIVLACHGAADNFIGLCILRVLLGIFESTISPGFALMTGLWYKPSEHAARHGVWFLGNSVGGLFGAIIAYACAHITGGPIQAWRWLFIILGIITFLWGFFLLFFLPDAPLTARFLTPSQRVIADRRPQKLQQSFKSNKWVHSQFVEAMKDPKTWLLFSIIAVASLTNGVISNFSSLIVKSLGFNTLDTLLLGMPGAGFQFMTIVISTLLASRFRKSRCIIIMGGMLVALLGVLLIRQLPTHMKAGRYAGSLLLIGSSNIFPLLLSLISSNVGGFTKKATVNAVFFIGYCAGNIGGPQLFILKEAPTYNTAYTALLVLYCVVIGMLVCLRQYMNWENKRRDKAQGVYIDPEPLDSDGELVLSPAERSEQTDWENERFRYYL